MGKFCLLILVFYYTRCYVLTKRRDYYRPATVIPKQIEVYKRFIHRLPTQHSLIPHLENRIYNLEAGYASLLYDNQPIFYYNTATEHPIDPVLLQSQVQLPFSIKNPLPQRKGGVFLIR